MRLHLLTVEGAQQIGKLWRIAPSIRLRSLGERAPRLMMPMAGEEIELRLPGGQAIPALIASFGVDAWKDGGGNLHVTTDPANPSLTLTITSDGDLGAPPPGTEIWLINARYGSASEDA